jgi:hypothetical protein
MTRNGDLSAIMPNALSPDTVQLTAAAIFALAVLHTFATRFLQHLAHIQPNHAGLWHRGARL